MMSTPSPSPSPTPPPPPGTVERAAARGGVWTVAAEASHRLSAMVTLVTLAGLLTTRQFGLASVAFLTIVIVNSLTYAGFGPAVQALGANERRDRTAVTLGVLCGIGGAAVIWLLADVVAAAVRAPEAAPLIRLIALSLPLTQYGEVTNALLERDLRFRGPCLAQVVASVCSCAAGIGWALAGGGAEALVLQAMVQQVVRALLVGVQRPSTLRPGFDRRGARELWGVGRQVMGSGIFGTAFTNLDNSVVARVTGPVGLGGYAFAYSLTNVPYFLIGIGSVRVLLPFYRRLLAEGRRLDAAFRSAFAAVVWAAALPGGFLAVAGPAALGVVFGDKWSAFDSTLVALAGYGWLRTVAATAEPALVASGRAATQRRVLQYQLALMLVLVVPGAVLGGTLGAALAVTVALGAGTVVLLSAASEVSGVRRGSLARSAAEAAVAGTLAGLPALAVLHALPSVSGLAAALLVCCAAWALLLLLREPTLVRALLGHLLPGRAAVPGAP